jgi:restriction endonuclease S subunit
MECFKVYSNEIEGRIDPFYYKSEFRKLEQQLKNIVTVPFGELIENITNGLDYRDFSDDGLFYLRVSNVRPFDFDLTDVRKVNLDYDGISKNIKLKKGDILLTRKGTFGVALSVKEDSDFIISSEIFRITLKTNVNPKYIEIILNSNICQRQFDKYKIGAIMGSLSQEAVRQIKITVLPLEIQNKIVQLMDNAYSLKKSKESEAKQLLDSLDDYVLDELGIKVPELKDKICYAVDSEEVKNKRADPYYYQPKFEEVEKAIKEGKYGIVKIREIVDESANKTVRIENNEKYIYIEIGDINKSDGTIILKAEEFGEKLPTGSKKKLIENDVIISTVRPYLKGIAKVKNCEKNLVSTGAFCVLRCTKKINPDYLLGVVRSDLFINMVCRNMSGTTYPTVSDEDILDLETPLPPLEIQNKIAEEVKTRMQKADKLQEEARSILEEAKEKVERIILGNEEI